MADLVRLVISDEAYVQLDGGRLSTRDEVTKALRTIQETRPDVTILIEADSSKNYEAIGKAIYGAHSAGFSGHNLRIVVDGKVLGV